MNHVRIVRVQALHDCAQRQLDPSPSGYPMGASFPVARASVYAPAAPRLPDTGLGAAPVNRSSPYSRTSAMLLLDPLPPHPGWTSRVSRPPQVPVAAWPLGIPPFAICGQVQVSRATLPWLSTTESPEAMPMSWRALVAESDRVSSTGSVEVPLFQRVVPWPRDR